MLNLKLTLMPDACHIKRDGGSYFCNMEGADNEVYSITFQSLLLSYRNRSDKQLNLPDEASTLYDQPTLFKSTRQKVALWRKAITWQQADLILSNCAISSNNDRFESMKRIAHSYANFSQSQMDNMKTAIAIAKGS